MLNGIDHVQLTMPDGEEHLAAARHIYADALGMREIAKPEALRDRGGLWFSGGTFEVHLGIEEAVETRRHPGLLTDDLAALRVRLEALDVAFEDQPPLGDRDRIHFRDPFGNRIEVVQYRR